MVFSTWAKRVLVVVFLAAMWVPLLLVMVGPSQQVSETERRRLAPAPEVHLDSRLLTEFPKQFESFYNDHFGLRQRLIRWYNHLRVRWLGVSPSQWVLVGQDGWLYQGGDPHVRDIRNAWPYRPKQLERWASILTAKRDWLASQGVAYLFVAVPSKHLAYPEYLPTNINRVRPTSRLDQLVQHLEKHSDVPVLDLRPALSEAREIRRTYHRTDTHWNDWGAYRGYRALIERVAAVVPTVRTFQLSADSFVTVDRRGGGLAQNLDMADVLRERSIEAQPWDASCVEFEGIAPDADVDAKHQNAFATRCHRAGGRVLMFRDSYSLAMMPYLSESFAVIHYIPASPVSLATIQQLVEQHRPDIVIEQRASRWLRMPGGY